MQRQQEVEGLRALFLSPPGRQKGEKQHTGSWRTAEGRKESTGGTEGHRPALATLVRERKATHSVFPNTPYF